jgi:VanZ family protein
MVNDHQGNRLHTASAVLLAGYWLALFAGTHIQQTPQVILSLAPSDKWLHFGAYAGLAFLIALNWRQRRAFGWRQWTAALVLLAAFGALDELTQMPVGRDCDVFDWIADLEGSLVGLVVFLALAALWQWARRRDR